MYDTSSVTRFTKYINRVGRILHPGRLSRLKGFFFVPSLSQLHWTKFSTFFIDIYNPIAIKTLFVRGFAITNILIFKNCQILEIYGMVRLRSRRPVAHDRRCTTKSLGLRKTERRDDERSRKRDTWSEWPIFCLVPCPCRSGILEPGLQCT